MHLVYLLHVYQEPGSFQDQKVFSHRRYGLSLTDLPLMEERGAAIHPPPFYSFIHVAFCQW